MAKCEAWVIYLLQTSAGYHVCDIISTSVVPTHARGDVTLWLYALIEPTKCMRGMQNQPRTKLIAICQNLI